MMECVSNCIHCQHIFNGNNLKVERRRKVGKHSDVDLVEVISNCYQLDEDLFRQFVEKNEDIYVCNSCFLILKGINTGQKKCSQLINTLKTNVSNDFKNFTIKFDSDLKKSLKRNRAFAADGRPRQKHRQSCLYKNLNLLQEPEDNFCKEKKPEANFSLKSEEDYKWNYSCCLLREGLMDWCREDAAKENDGDRLIRMWRFDMLRFAISNHTKYKLLAFKLQAQLMALLPPKLAYELKHNRTVNIHGGEGGNVPCDLALEFMNMRAKDALNGLHGNFTSKSIQRCGRSLQGCNSIVDSYTQGLEQYFGKPSNSKPSLQKDIDMLVEKLISEKLFARIPGCSHRSFPTIDFDTMKKNEW